MDELLATTPTIRIEQQTYTKSAIDRSFYLEIEKRFDPKVCCRIATTNEVAPFAPRVYAELVLCPTRIYLLQDLKHCNHGFKCDELGLQLSVGKVSASLDIPMAVSFMSNDVAMIRPGQVIFASALSRTNLHVD